MPFKESQLATSLLFFQSIFYNVTIKMCSHPCHPNRPGHPSYTIHTSHPYHNSHPSHPPQISQLSYSSQSFQSSSVIVTTHNQSSYSHPRHPIHPSHQGSTLMAARLPNWQLKNFIWANKFRILVARSNEISVKVVGYHE